MKWVLIPMLVAFILAAGIGALTTDAKRPPHRHHSCRWYVVHHKRLIPRRCRRVIVKIIKQYNETHQDTYIYNPPPTPNKDCPLVFIGICP